MAREGKLTEEDVMDILIDIMTIDDLDDVIKIENKSFSDPWSYQSFKRDIIFNNHSLYLCAYKGRNLIAYIGGWLIVNKLHITNLAVDPEYRRKGIATKLIDEIFKMSILQGINKITLEVRMSNDAAIKLYKKKGFIVVGRYLHYYSNNNEDALIMWKEFKNE
jgi:[ribosomal protein S18]-alanine N-acetyltransferase